MSSERRIGEETHTLYQPSCVGRLDLLHLQPLLPCHASLSLKHSKHRSKDSNCPMLTLSSLTSSMACAQWRKLFELCSTFLTRDKPTIGVRLAGHLFISWKLSLLLVSLISHLHL